jgi:predicted N-acetyltransferase YhbS
VTTRILALSQHRDLAPLIAEWRVAAFFQGSPRFTAESYAAAILAPPRGPEEHFVLFEDETPVGTVGVVHRDLEARPDLTPWLAGLLVLPAHRRAGHGATLVRQAEAFAREAGVPVLWLYTLGAEPFYRRLGWRRESLEQDGGHPVVLMRRDLA